MTQQDIENAISKFEAFQILVGQTLNLALANGLGADVISAVGSSVAAASAEGMNAGSDMAALTAVNKVIQDLVTAKKSIVTQTPS